MVSQYFKYPLPTVNQNFNITINIRLHNLIHFHPFMLVIANHAYIVYCNFILSKRVEVTKGNLLSVCRISLLFAFFWRISDSVFLSSYIYYRAFMRPDSKQYHSANSMKSRYWVFNFVGDLKWIMLTINGFINTHQSQWMTVSFVC